MNTTSNARPHVSMLAFVCMLILLLNGGGISAAWAGDRVHAPSKKSFKQRVAFSLLLSVGGSHHYVHHRYYSRGHYRYGYARGRWYGRHRHFYRGYPRYGRFSDRVYGQYRQDKRDRSFYNRWERQDRNRGRDNFRNADRNRDRRADRGGGRGAGRNRDRGRR